MKTLNLFLPLIGALLRFGLVLVWSAVEACYWLLRQIPWTKVLNWIGFATWLTYKAVSWVAARAYQAYDDATSVSFTIALPPVTQRHPALGFA